MKSTRLLAVLIAVCVLLSSMATVSFAAEGEFTCSNVSFGYVTGETWEDAAELKAGKDLTAKISVSKTGEKQSVIFTLIVYNGDRIFDVNTVTEEIGADKTDLIAVVTLPGDVEDCYVSAFLWDNYVDANPICNISGFPDASVAVTGIYVDGAPVEKFDPATKTYDFAVEGDRTIMPEVTVTTLDLGAKVTITNPTRFPGSTVIKVTNGSGDENTYTVNYVCNEGFVNSIDYTPNVYEAIQEDMIIPSLYKNFGVDSKAFFDRAFLVTDVADESLLGLNYIGVGIGWKNSPPYRDYYKMASDEGSDWWTFSIARDAKVIIVSQAKIDAYTDLGFDYKEVADIIKVDVNGSPYKYKAVQSREYKKGSVITLPTAYASAGYFVFFEFEGYKPTLVPGASLTGIEIASKPDKLEYKIGDELDLTGLTVNAVHSNGVKVPVTDYDVEPCDMAMGTNTVTVNYAGFTASFDVEVKGVTFGLSSLKVDGNAVADFNIATKEYNVVIPSTQVKFPVVDAVATDGGLVSVTNPTEFPGKATVKVTKAGEEDAVYTLNYVLDKEVVENVTVLGDNKIPEVYGGGNVSAKPKYRKGGFVVGTPAYSDREDRTEGGARYSVLEITDPRLVGGDYITGGITWYNGSTPTVAAFTSADTLDWLQFTVNRDATVYVLKHHNNDKEKFESYGYTQSVSDNDKGYLYTLLNGSNHRYHKYMYSKKVTAGTKVIVPNSTDNNNIYHTVITYDSYEELKPQAPSLTGIEITSEPSKLTYTEGEELDLTGLVVKANYSDSSSEKIDTYTVSECDMAVGKHTITVTYEGYTDTFEITVEALPEEIFGLTALTVDGKAVANVSSAVYEYNVVIPTNQKEVPVVEATVSEGATYEVTEPETFPGSVTLTVSKDGKEDAEYTINYTLEEEVISNIDYGSVAKGATGHNEKLLPVLYSNFSVGATPAMYDRNGVLHNSNSSVTAIGDEGFVGKDYFGVSFGWVHSPPYRDLYNGDYVADWWHFDVNRDAKLTLLVQNNSGDFHDDLIADGFVLDATKADYAKILVGTSNNYTYSYKYTKTVSAGETITLGSNKTSKGYFILIDYAGYSESEGNDPEVPVEPEEGLEIMKVKDGRDSIVAIVHDDNDFSTATYLNEVLGANGLKGSVGVIAKKINDNNKTSWQDIFDDGVLNVESHSMTHTYLGQDNTKDEVAMVDGVETEIPAGKMETEIAGSKEALMEYFPGQNPLIYIIAGVGTVTDTEGNSLTATNANAIEMIKDNYIAARVTGGTAFTKTGVDTIPPTDYYNMYAIMPKADTTYETMMASVDEAVENNGIMIFCFHAINNTGTGVHPTAQTEADKVFADLGQYVEEGKVWNPFYADAVKYMKETETAVATMETVGDAIEVTVIDELDNEVYDYPVTVKVPVPADWEYVLLTQGERTENPETFTEGNETFVYANIVPDCGKATITKSEFVADDLALTSIEVDGVELENFKERTTNYSYMLTAEQIESIDAPAVTYTLADAENSSAVVTNPTEFPGSVTITVTNKDDETRTYTVKYKSNEVFTDVSVADSSARLPDFVSGGFVTGAQPYFNRANYTINEINDESLAGKDYFKGNIEWQNNEIFKSATYTPWITLNTLRDVKVNILKTTSAGYSDMEANGFTYTTSDNATGFVKADTNSAKNFKYSFTKDFEKGEVVIPGGMTNKAYFVVFDFAPWGEEIDAPAEPTLSGIEITSEPTKLTYTEGEELDLTGLVVKANYSDSSSEEIDSYTVSECDMTAGTHTITVTYEGFTDSFNITVEAEPVEEAELVYDIAYTDNVYENTTVTASTFKPYLSENLQVNSPAYFCRDGVNDTRTSFITAVGDDSYLGLPYMGVGIAWKNSPPFRDYYGTDPAQWFKFTVGKDVKLTLLTTAKVDAFESSLGFTYEAKSNAMKTIINNSTNYTFGHTYTKTFSAGDTIVFPSFRSSNALIILFDEIVSEQ